MASIFRGVLGLPLAGVITIALFLFMYSLIRVLELPTPPESQDININFKTQLQDTEVRNQKVFERPALDQPPPPPPAINNASFQPDVGSVPVTPPTLGASVNIGTAFNPDRDAQPLVRINPTGWERCLDSRGGAEEQRVNLEFDVTPDGRVTNVQVISSTDSCYERSAIRAAQQWKYQPKIVDGEAQPRRGVRTTIVYQGIEE